MATAFGTNDDTSPPWCKTSRTTVNEWRRAAGPSANYYVQVRGGTSFGQWFAQLKSTPFLTPRNRKLRLALWQSPPSVLKGGHLDGWAILKCRAFPHDPNRTCLLDCVARPDNLVEQEWPRTHLVPLVMGSNELKIATRIQSKLNKLKWTCPYFLESSWPSWLKRPPAPVSKMNQPPEANTPLS